jgi:hypothetical protein
MTGTDDVLRRARSAYARRVWPAAYQDLKRKDIDVIHRTAVVGDHLVDLVRIWRRSTAKVDSGGSALR